MWMFCVDGLETLYFIISSVEIFSTEFLYCCQLLLNVYKLTGWPLSAHRVVSGAGLLSLLTADTAQGLAGQGEDDGETPHGWSRDVRVLRRLLVSWMRWSMTARIVRVSVPLPHGTLTCSRLNSARHSQPDEYDILQLHRKIRTITSQPFNIYYRFVNTDIIQNSNH